MRTREHQSRLPLVSKTNDFYDRKGATTPITTAITHCSSDRHTSTLSLTAHFTKLQRLSFSSNPLSPNNSQFNKSAAILQAPASD